MREDADEQSVYSVIVAAFIKEKDMELKSVAAAKKRLEEQKIRGVKFRPEEYFLPPGENRAHMWLDHPLQPFLSPKGLEFMQDMD